MDTVRTTRTRILDAAQELLGREGPDGFSAAALAREAGVSKATVFHHFDTMDAIPLAAVERLFFEPLAQPPAPGQSLHDYLAQMGDDIGALVAEQQKLLNVYFVFFTKSLFDDRLGDRARLVMRGLYGALDTYLRPLLPPETPKDEVYDLVRMIGSLLDGLILHQSILADPGALERTWHRFVHLVLQRYAPDELVPEDDVAPTRSTP